MMQVRKKKSKFQKPIQTQSSLSPQELEALRLQINHIEEQVNIISLALAPLDARSVNGLRSLGVILYFLFLPLRWGKRAWTYLKQPQSCWIAFYWMSFAWVLILDGGLKEVLISLRHPSRLVRAIGLPNNE